MINNRNNLSNDNFNILTATEIAEDLYSPEVIKELFTDNYKTNTSYTDLAASIKLKESEVILPYLEVILPYLKDEQSELKTGEVCFSMGS